MLSNDRSQPVVLQIPVRGFFICPNTPGSKVPSHGINQYGVEYAIDFVMVAGGAGSPKPYASSVLAYLIKGLPLSDFYGWGMEVYSPVQGVVAQAADGMDERDPVNIFNDLRNAARVTRAYNSNMNEAKNLLGNHVIIRTEGMEYIVLAHLQKNSVAVKAGQNVDLSSVVGRLGHSGNSTMPHLHLQAMDDPDFRKAKGLPILFSHYCVMDNGNKVEYRMSIPVRDQVLFFGQ